MDRASNALAELLAGKTPEAMYDALYAGRYLSAVGQDSPPEVLALIKTFVRSSRQRALMPATLSQRLAAALAGSGFLNEAGEQLASQETPRIRAVPTPAMHLTEAMQHIAQSS